MKPRTAETMWALVAALALAGAGLGALGLLLPLLDGSSGMASTVDLHMGRSGVEHPLTAVLLNFRGFDTLLEIGVLLAAVVAVRSLAAGHDRVSSDVPPYTYLPVLRTALGVLIPLAAVIAGYMVWIGSYEPGGAFQGGAIIGAAWVVLIVAGVIRTPLTFTTGLRAAAALGFFYFSLSALAVGLLQGELLTYPPALAGKIILSIETLLSISIGTAIGLLFASVYRAAQPDPGAPEGDAS